MSEVGKDNEFGQAAVHEVGLDMLGSKTRRDATQDFANLHSNLHRPDGTLRSTKQVDLTGIVGKWGRLRVNTALRLHREIHRNPVQSQ